MSEENSPSGIGKDGLIVLNEMELAMIQNVNLYYDAGGRWWGPDAQGGFSSMKDSQAAFYVSAHGFSKSAKHAGNALGQTPADRALMWLQQRRKVSYAGPLAGYAAGVQQVGSDRILVTEPTRIVKPVKGECPKIRELIESMLMMPSAKNGERTRQINVFYTLLSSVYKTLLERVETGKAIFRFTPALAIVGVRECGKSALVNLVLQPLLGGKKADPTSYLLEPKFNKDLFVAPLLVMDDKGSPPAIAIRRERGENIKGLIWEKEQRMRGMFADAIQLCPFRFLVMACNFDEAALQILPTLTEGMADKIIHLLAQRAEWLPSSNEENDKWVEELAAELPAFAWFLKNYKAPKNAVLNSRSRVMLYSHPAVIEKLRGFQPEIKLLDLIDLFKLAERPEDPDAIYKGYWEGSATEFHNAMQTADKGKIYDGLFSSMNAVGRALAELVNVVPDRVRVTNHGNKSHYRIMPAVKEETGE